jgi:hypothetical protein
MDQLDRVYRSLVQSIRSNFPQYLTQPFEVAELYQTILPYRHHRRSLGFDTNQDYEVALLELLAGERGYLLVEERMRDTLKRELGTPNPDPAVFRQFASSQISLAHEPLRGMEARLDAEPTSESDRVTGSMPSPAVTDAIGRVSSAANPPPGITTGPGSARPARPSVPTSGAVPRSSAPSGASRAGTPGAGAPIDGGTGIDRGVIANPGDGCRFCGGQLPAGRRLTFCPHCGQDLTVQHCLACGTELELGWKFCISCGRGVAAG